MSALANTPMDADIYPLLEESLRRYVAENYDFEQRKASLNAAPFYRREVWQDFAEFGWLAMRLPEKQGGINADARTLALFMQTVGSHLLMEPVLPSLILATGLLLRQASEAQSEALLPRLAEGSLTLAFAHQNGVSACVAKDGLLYGEKVSVLNGDSADMFIVSTETDDGGSSLWLVEAGTENLQRKPYRLVDGRGAAILKFDGVAAEPLGSPDASQALADSLDEAQVALCAETLGAAQSLVDRTNAYLKIRKQFGRPIGTNQALQHRMTELFILLEEIRALTATARDALSRPQAERGAILSGARAYCAQAGQKIANEAVQMHGGVGITEELDISHYFRRLMVCAALFGGTDMHIHRFMDQTLKNRQEP